MNNIKNFIEINILFFQSVNTMGWILFLIIFLMLLNLISHLEDILKKYAFLNIIFYTIAIIFSVFYLFILYIAEKISYILKITHCLLLKNKKTSSSLSIADLRGVSKVEILMQEKRKNYFKVNETSADDNKKNIKTKKEKRNMDKLTEVISALVISVILFIGFFNDEFARAMIKHKLQTDKETSIMNEKNCIPEVNTDGSFKMNKLCHLKTI